MTLVLLATTESRLEGDPSPIVGNEADSCDSDKDDTDWVSEKVCSCVASDDSSSLNDVD